ncbi:MAG: hypothetical protein JWO07_474, partial [Candidatus Saccharibacteria bacterium]|nr:hypothetical protein [Candidatus Saccharibacteria bacterium]
ASDFICFGKSPALGYLWSGAYNPATIVTGFTNPDITDMDNGESPDLFFTIFPPGASGGLFGYVCAVDAGISKCTSQSESYTGTSGAAGFQQLTTSTGTPAMQGLATTKIAAGSHAVCLIPNGQLYCYGSAATGALANNSTGTDLPNATLTGTMTNGVAGSTKIGTLGTNLASNPTNFTFAASGSISVGGGHACGIVNGDVYCWGKNDYGQDGTGDTTDVAQPTTPPLTAGTVADKVSAGGSHTCAISKNQLYCWGRNDNGQLGMGNTTSPILVPTLVTAFAGKRVTDVSAGLNGTCAIANGQAYCWGKNDYGQAGTTIGQQNSPVAVSGITADATGNGKVATSISMGDRHACAVVNGDAYCWGSNANCALAIALCVGTYSSAQKVTGGSMSGSYNNLTSNNVTGVSAGNDFSCAIVNNNVACWGLNTSGQVGTNSATGNITTPSWIKDSSGTPITAEATTISAGSQHACATLQGVIYCWGENGNSQLGDTTATDKIYAEPITGGDTNCNGTTCAGDTSSGTVQATINVAAGGDSTCSVSNAKILCWGDSSNGRVGNLGAAGNTSLPLGTSNYVFQVPYYKGPIF